MEFNENHLDKLVSELSELQDKISYIRNEIKDMLYANPEKAVSRGYLAINWEACRNRQR